MTLYGVIGNPVEHSLSPIIHQAFAEQTHQELNYEKIKAPINGFEDVVRDFQERGGQGLNVTLPFKVNAFRLANDASVRASEAGAASVLCFRDDTIFADNFDGLGLVNDLIKNKNLKLADKKILILGAGGAAQGILGPLLLQKPKEIVIANRTLDKALNLAKHFKDHGSVVGIDMNALTPNNFDLIINATSMGHTGVAPTLAPELIRDQTVCYDLSYGQAAKPFLNVARKEGAKATSDGLGMLVEHNALVFHLWFGIIPDTSLVLNQLQNQLK